MADVVAQRFLLMHFQNLFHANNYSDKEFIF